MFFGFNVSKFDQSNNITYLTSVKDINDNELKSGVWNLSGVKFNNSLFDSDSININSSFVLPEDIEFKGNFEIKDLEIQEEKEALKEYGSSSSGASIGDIIGAALEEDKKKSKDETK